MATQKQIEYILKRMESANPSDCFKEVDLIRAGIGAVLRLLHDAGQGVSAGTISDTLRVSTARVAVILKKMATKGLITREQDALDGRVTLVTLTESGEKAYRDMRAELCEKLSVVIDAVGEDRLLAFIAVAEEITAALAKSEDADQ